MRVDQLEIVSKTSSLSGAESINEDVVARRIPPGEVRPAKKRKVSHKAKAESYPVD